MIFEALAIISFVVSSITCGLFLLNLFAYRAPRSGSREAILPRHGKPDVNDNHPAEVRPDAVSVLIPARNEENNLRATLESVLANDGIDLEVIVLDDHSADGTASIVAEYVERDSRVRLEAAPSLRPGWCGKQHACHALAKLARNPLLVFIDADVRLAPDALKKMAAFMASSNAHLASGVPRQELGTFSERLLIPLIHFILLGFLPMHWARRSTRPAFAAGCGQLFIARADAYHRAGGHAAIRASLHDGVKLPRAFRAAGLRTELFDATGLATCRMYRTNPEVWRGLGKNAVEGIAAPGTIGPMTLLLLGGQVMPVVLHLVALLSGLEASARTLAVVCAATALSYLPRLIAVWRFRQPLGGALLHPIGILCLLLIQWSALVRSLTGRPSMWKGRSYSPENYTLAGAGAKAGGK